MFKSMMMPVSIYFINSLWSGLYTNAFLTAKKNKKITIGLWAFIYFILQFIMFEIVAREWPAVDVIAIIVNIGILFIMQLMMFNKDFVKQGFVIFSFMAGKETVKYIASITYYSIAQIGKNVFDSLFEKGSISTVEQVDNYFEIEIVIITTLVALTYTAILGVYLYVINKKFVRRDYRFTRPEYCFLIAPAICALCISVTIKLMIYSVEDKMPVFVYEEEPTTLFWIPVVCILLLLSVIITVIIFQNIIQYQEEALKSKVLESQVSQIQREVSEMQEIYADVRGVKHDMRSHLANIAAYIATGNESENEELKSYIMKLENVIDKLDFAYQTGNPITDVIIHQKSQEAQKRKIDFLSDFIYPGKKQIDVYDLGVILNNALDNAIEACEKVKGEKRIVLRSYEKGSLFFVEVSNTFSEVTFDKKSGLPITDKTDKSIHGFGLSNIQKAAKKYMGDLDIEIDKEGNSNIFYLTVMLCKACE